MTAADRPTVRAGLGHRGQVTLILSLLVDQLSAGQLPDVTGWRPRSPWDIWWVCFRTGLPASTLGLAHLLQLGARMAECDACRRLVVDLTSNAPTHPGPDGDNECGCFTAWAVSLRSPEPQIHWPALVSGVAMVKPGTELGAVTDLLSVDFEIHERITRALTVADVRRLYPDAYGAAFVSGRDAYLTSSPSTVLTLRAKTPARAGTEYKRSIRRALGHGDLLRNHLHMPDNPGETWCDLRLLAGDHNDLYRRYDSGHATDRVDHYRHLLGLEQPRSRAR
ncbi:hypothetical protein ACFV9C_42870 [Kribbella sp. NPDC059898]|uniref:hypothetical protein n=1 Tax=Kribbella sp. NPDC059898 TaxID=3346995 RepID=UPI003651221D